MASCPGTSYSIPQMLDMARRSGYTGAGQVEIVAHALVESGGCDRAYNTSSGARGILQFIPETAARAGLQDPYNAQASFDASYRLSGGSNFGDWTPYEPAAAFQSALSQVRSTGGAAPSSPGLQLGATTPGTGLVAGKQMDPWGIGQAIANVAGYTGGTFRAAGTGFVNMATVGAGLLVLGAGIAVLTWLFMTRTDTGRGIQRVGRDAASAARRTAEAAIIVAPK